VTDAAELAREHEELLAMHAALAADATRYRVLFDLAPTALVVTDANMVIREANEAAARLFEVNPRFLLRKPLLAYVDLSNRKPLRVSAVHGESTTANVRMRRRSGVAFDAAVHASRRRDEIFFAIVDQTAEVQAEKRLWELNRELERRVREQAAELEALVAQLPVGVVVLARDGSVAWANRRAEEIVGPLGPHLELRGEDGVPLEPDERPAARVLRGEAIRDLRVRASRADGGEVVVDVTAIPVSSEERGAVVVLHDATERDRIERADAEFVENAAHQLRTPITAVAASVAALNAGALEEEEEEEDRRRFVEHIRRESERMARLVESLLTLAALQRGGGQPDLDVVPLQRLVDDVVATADVPDDVVVEAHCADDVAVVASRDLLLQAIGNVVTNAAQHTVGRVLITARIDGPSVLLDVTDFGPGVAAEARDRIFERFFRASPNGRRGSGLGLAIALAAAKAAVSSLELLPQREGEGATFRFTMPGARLR